VPRPTVLLFDIDGTLVWTGGAGRRAMERAFELVTGSREATRFPFAGMTDRAIARAGLTQAGHSDDEATMERVLELYLELLVAEVASSGDYGVYPGMRAAIDAASARDGVALGLGTGNLERGARIKLGRVGLADVFEFGGFGSDHEDRAELLRVGARRGAERLAADVRDCRVVVIGDTPRDVSAALAIGAECIGVGTGGEPPERLRALGATAAFADLGADGALDALFG
jgi:phosphoglycolate phosphatase